VRGDVDEAQLRELRAQFIAAAGWATYDEAQARLGRRDAILHASQQEDEIVLWFEHDLYDQLQLIDVLTRLASPARRPRRIAQVSSNQYLGTLPAEWFRAEFTYREPVSDAAWIDATRAWRAFTAPDPRPLDALRASLIELPFLADALTRHLQEFPSIENGLSRLERQLLTALADGPHDLLAAFHASHHDCEEAVFLGDVVFAWHIARLSRGEAPLLQCLDGRSVWLPRELSPAFWEQRIVLTSTGERILAGQIDRVAIVGIDRWLGGVHLEGHAVGWRWDERQRRLVS
jgi:hypothetical protein